MLNQKEIVVKRNHIVVISANTKNSCKVPYSPCCGHFSSTFWGNFGTVIKSISSCPLNSGTAGRQGEIKKHTHTELVEQARRVIRKGLRHLLNRLEKGPRVGLFQWRKCS